MGNIKINLVKWEILYVIDRNLNYIIILINNFEL